MPRSSAVDTWRAMTRRYLHAPYERERRVYLLRAQSGWQKQSFEHDRGLYIPGAVLRLPLLREIFFEPSWRYHITINRRDGSSRTIFLIKIRNYSKWGHRMRRRMDAYRDSLGVNDAQKQAKKFGSIGGCLKLFSVSYTKIDLCN